MQVYTVFFKYDHKCEQKYFCLDKQHYTTMKCMLVATTYLIKNFIKRSSLKRINKKILDSKKRE